jgi:hypothetical protein
VTTAGSTRWPPAATRAVAAMIVVASLGRGVYILNVEARRPLAQASLPATPWTDVATWLTTQPASWHVLADPQHAWKYGSTVRVAARRDTVLDLSKDPSIAMYSREIAMRVAERSAALEGFDDLSIDQLRVLDRRYAVDVMVDRTTRALPLPILYRNPEFIVYDLR